MSIEYQLSKPEDEIPVYDYLKNQIANYIAIALLQSGEGGIKKIALTLTDGIMNIIQGLENTLQDQQIKDPISITNDNNNTNHVQ